MLKIKLSQGRYALVDKEDFEWLNQWKWSYDHGYARGIKDGKIIYMHRLIVNPIKGLETDHVNRNGLDNRRCNLRAVTPLQNILNRGISKCNKSGTKGVIWHKGAKKWMAFIIVNYKQIYLGVHKDIHQAISVRKNAERVYFA